ncbi:hypothetical protein [Marivirga harenae]|uniref:hypothetical protein n=1 Tax=Marivirga harenae TaxID=2010992 RepID=UPI0026E067C0|nr:hypothetical protein [Marivirga harenae]WKV12554.1 hypothetical protein Q3Y49_01735 [Marivirga harenae]|tara:strand:- start:40193 stop:41257 length:1065 start_codon:yes stop_codon:yes gene_type:complete
MKILLIRCILFFVFIQYSFVALSQIGNKGNQQFFKHLYNFEFYKADSLLSNLDSIQDASQYNFLKSHFMRWYYLPIHEQDDKILSLYNQYLEATTNEDNELNYLFVNSALLKAEFNYNQGNYYKAYHNGSKVYELVKLNLEKAPDKEELMFLSALYHYYYQYYKNENPIYGSMMWLFKEGNKQTGLEWLKIVAGGESIAKTEALIYLSHIYLRLENNLDSAFKYAEILHQMYPENLKFYEVYLESAISNNLNNESVQLLIQELQNSRKIYFQKYGICYKAIQRANRNDKNKRERILDLKNALSFIERNGGGNHLSSLIYYSLHQLTGEEEYLRQKNKYEVYQFALTGYLKSESN